MMAKCVSLLLGPTIIFTSLFSVFARAANSLPEKWKNNPNFEIVYLTRVPIYNSTTNKNMPVGTKVTISRRKFDDTLIRDEAPNYGLLVVGERFQDDPGIRDAEIAARDLFTSLKPTLEPSPLPHWEIYYAKFADTEIPNIKVNRYYAPSFPEIAFAALPHKNDERPFVIFDSIPFRLVKQSPYCLGDELTVRLKNSKEVDPFYVKKMNENQKVYPDLVFSDFNIESDYCVKLKRFTQKFTAYDIVDPNSVDALTWEDYLALNKKFVPSATAKGVIRVSPFSKFDKDSGRDGPNILLVPDENGWTASYMGPLYYACAGGACRLQGYKVHINKDGVVDNFIENRLYLWDGRNELLLKDRSIKLLTNLCNHREMLAEAYVWAKNKQENYFTASMSRLSQLVEGRAGNSFGTFILHLSKIREYLELDKTQGWPIYTGPSPGGEKH